MGIESWNGIIHQVNLFVGVDCSGKSKSSFLSATEVYSFLSDLSLVTSFENFEVMF